MNETTAGDTIDIDHTNILHIVEERQYIATSWDINFLASPSFL